MSVRSLIYCHVLFSLVPLCFAEERTFVINIIHKGLEKNWFRVLNWGHSVTSDEFSFKRLLI